MTERPGTGSETRTRRGSERRIDGVMVIDKPEGMTSMDVVRRIKRASRVKKVGHGGTLDPFATGVIVVCMGQATRMMEYLVDGAKTYRGVVELGIETDTYDVQGEVTRRTDASGVTVGDVEAALEEFRGVILQVPPMYSALKRQGKRLYDLARAGVEVEREPRRVEVTDVAVVDWSPPLVEVSVECGRGFYMRSLGIRPRGQPRVRGVPEEPRAREERPLRRRRRRVAGAGRIELRRRRLAARDPRPRLHRRPDAGADRRQARGAAPAPGPPPGPDPEGPARAEQREASGLHDRRALRGA